MDSVLLFANHTEWNRLFPFHSKGLPRGHSTEIHELFEVVECSWVEGALARAPSSANLSSAHLSSARSLLKIVECSSFEARVGVRVFRVEKKGAFARIPKH